jgi:hypothetical protein
MSTNTHSGTAYSYLRFSTKKQERGDSIRRQIEARDLWLKRHPLVTLAPDGAYEELGTSSFRGKHRLDDKTALKQFINAVESGRVKPGAFLIVESFDRLTREEFGGAAEFVLGLVNRGIRIVQVSPVEVILEKPVDLTKALRSSATIRRRSPRRNGSRLTTVNRHKQKVLATSSFRRRGSADPSFPLVPFERAILSHLRELGPSAVLGTGDGPDEVAELRAKVTRADSVLRALADQFDDGSEDIPVVAEKVKAKNAERKALATLLEAAESRAASPLSVVWGETQGILGVLDQTPDARLTEVRSKLKAALARIIDSVTCVFGGSIRLRWAAVRVQFSANGAHRDYVIVHKSKNGHSPKPEETWSQSHSWPTAVGEVDLRTRTDATKVERFLAAADVGDLCVVLGAPQPKKEPSQKRKDKKPKKRAG